MNLYTLNLNKSLFSTYAKDKSYIITSPNQDTINVLRQIFNSKFIESRTWMNNIKNVNMYAENHIDIKMTNHNYCDINDSEYKSLLEVTYFQTENQTDILFIYQLSNLMNTHVFMVDSFEYNDTIPLLSLQGFFIEYKPDNEDLIEIDFMTYLNSMYKI